MITEGEFKDWKQHPVTIEMLRLLGMKREELRQAWEGGSFTDWTEEGTMMINVGNIGTCKGYAFMQDLDYTGYATEIEDLEAKDGKH